MTHDELVKQCQAKIDEARGAMLRMLSPAQLAAIEAAGFRVVPAWMLDAIMRVLTSPGAKKVSERPGEGSKAGS